jgi:twitching motility two-component system response regulator PilG
VTGSSAFLHPNSTRRIVFKFSLRVMSKMGFLTILYVEDYGLLLHYVKGMLEKQGWQVETCADGLSALEKIEGGDKFDLLLLDNSLPGMSGLELVLRARSLTHRRRTPIIMLSASDFALAASRAGVSAFLKKPDEINALIETVRRLTGERLERA